MATTSEVRQRNVAAIRRLLWAGDLLSKKDIAFKLDLSVATCNTLLNEMAAAGEVVAEPRHTGSAAGRAGLCYRASENRATIVAAQVEPCGEERVFRARLLTLTGRELQSLEVRLARLDGEKLADLLAQACDLRDNVRQIVLGVPGTAQGGVIAHCDIRELNGADFASAVAATCPNIPIHVENDMHLKARGYSHQMCARDEVATLAYFPPRILPGTATVHAGEPIRGAHGLAGMVGFLPYEEAGRPITRDRLVELLAPATAKSYIAKGVASLCAALDPDVMVLSGGLLDATCTQWLREECLRTIPAEFLPAFRFEQSFERYYLLGMYQTALDHLERNL